MVLNTLDPNVGADQQLFGEGTASYVHIMNIGDEIVTGTEEDKGDADVGGVDTSLYKLRPLATISKTGRFFIPSSISKEALELSNYHQEIGINGPENRIIEVETQGFLSLSEAILENPDVLKEIGTRSISAFIESERIQKIREILGLQSPVSYKTVNNINNKCYFLSSMSEIGVNVAEGRTLHNLAELQKHCEDSINNGTIIYVKLARAASGQGVFCVSSLDELERVLCLPQIANQIEQLGIRVDKEIQGIIETPNVMIKVGKTEPEDIFISASAQILGKRHNTDKTPTVHKGNISISDPVKLKKLKKESKKIADWMRMQGAIGIVGLDFAIDEKGGMCVLEANYRVNGGQAAAMVGHDLKFPHWAAVNGIKVPDGTGFNRYIEHLQDQGIEYRQGNDSGLIILNNATMRAGAVQAAIVGGCKDRIIEIINKANMI